MYRYKAEVKRIVDGDTFDVIIDLGFSLKAEVRLRLAGIDTPEIYRPSCKAEHEHGKQAVEYIESIMPVGSVVVVETYKLGIYGRYSADVFVLSQSKDLKTLLVENQFEKLSSYPEDAPTE